MPITKTKQNIPKGWQRVKLSDECVFERGIEPGSGNYFSDSSKGKRFLRVSDLSGSRDEKIYVDIETDKIAGSEDILLTLDGSVGLVKKGLEGIYSTGIRKVYFKKKQNPNEFLYFVLQSKRVQDTIREHSTGSTIKHAGRAVDYIQVSIPTDPKEQQKIAEILSVVDEEIQKTDEIISATEKLKRGLMAEIFKFPKRWKKIAINDMGEIITGTTPRTAKKENYGDEFVWVSPRDIVGQKYISESTKMLSANGFAQTRKLPSGSILVVCIGSTIGKVGIAAKELSTNQQINSIVVNKENDNEFIYYALLFNKARILEKAATQAVPIINKSTFSNISIAVPADKNEQRKIAATLSSLDKKVAINQKLKAKLTLLKKGLMQDLLTGKKRTI